MNPRAAKLLQGLVLLVGLGALAFLLGEPWLEGRNVHATAFQVYFRDPFLAFAYLGSIPFFVALVQAFRLAGDAGAGRMASQERARALRIIRDCALATIGLVAVGETFIVFGDSDDHADGVFMGVVVTLGALAIVAVATRLERPLRAAERIPS